jgi:hypothetical protein
VQRNDPEDGRTQLSLFYFFPWLLGQTAKSFSRDIQRPVTDSNLGLSPHEAAATHSSVTWKVCAFNTCVRLISIPTTLAPGLQSVSPWFESRPRTFLTSLSYVIRYSRQFQGQI